MKVSAAVICLLVACAGASAQGGAGAQGAGQKSLNERLGGLEASTAVIDEFIAIAGADERINKKFASTNAPRVRLHFIEQVCMLTGGPCEYTGNDMRKAHKNMGLTEGEFNAGVEDVVKALDKFKVPEAEKQELLAALPKFKNDRRGEV